VPKGGCQSVAIDFLDQCFGISISDDTIVTIEQKNRDVFCCRFGCGLTEVDSKYIRLYQAKWVTGIVGGVLFMSSLLMSFQEKIKGGKQNVLQAPYMSHC
jgi:hypothetical protein